VSGAARQDARIAGRDDRSSVGRRPERAREAARRGLPVAAVNLGRMRADPLLELKVCAPCEEALATLPGSLRFLDSAGRER